MLISLIAPKKEKVYGRDAIIDLCSNYPIQNPKWVDAEITRLHMDPKTAKRASKHEKKKMKKSEEVIPKEVHIKTSNKRTKSVSSSGSSQG